MLPSDATLTDVKDTLAKPLEYVCGVLENLYKCKKQHGNAVVCIGVTGAGAKPYYRIMYDSDGKREEFGAFFDNHVSFGVEGRVAKDGDSWSTKCLTLAEVAQIRGSMKG
jgi:hypothetical protein